MSLETEGKNRVVTTQRKHGVWMCIFPNTENTGNSHRILKNLFILRQFTSNLGKVLNFKKLKNIIGLWWYVPVTF